MHLWVLLMKNKISDLLFLIGPFCLIFGIFIFSYISLYLFFLFSAISIFLFFIFIHQSRFFWRIILGGIFICIGGISAHISQYNLPKMIEKSGVYEFQFMQVMQIEPKDNKKYRYILKLDDHRLIQVTSSLKMPHIKHCNVVGGRVFLNKPSQKLTPTGFNFYQYSQYKKIIGYGWPLKAFEDRQIQRKNVSCRINQMRFSIYKKLQNYFSDQALALSSALLIGYKAQINDNIKTQFKSLGISHTLVISGLHIGLVSLFFFQMFRFIFALIPPLYRYYNIKSLAALLTIIMVVFYGLIAGYQAATLRACIMVIYGLLAIMSNRSIFSFRSFSFALITVLLINPNQIYMAGFQLSFLAVFGIILCHKLIFFKSRIRQNIFMTSFIALWLAPISLYYFGLTSFVGILANLFVLPLLTFIILPFMFLGFFIPYLWKVNNYLFLSFFENIQKLNTEDFIIATVAPSLESIAVFYIFISFILIISIYAKFKKSFTFFSVFMVYGLLFIYLQRQDEKMEQNILLYEGPAIIWRDSHKLYIHYFEDNALSEYQLYQIKQYFGVNPYKESVVFYGSQAVIKGKIWAYSPHYTHLNGLCLKADIVISAFDYRCWHGNALYLKRAFSTSFYQIQLLKGSHKLKIEYFRN